jgi:hypothetical protein
VEHDTGKADPGAGTIDGLPVGELAKRLLDRFYRSLHGQKTSDFFFGEKKSHSLPLPIL